MTTAGPSSLVLPPALKPGDLIGVAAPAGPFPHDRFQEGLARLQGLGFKTLVPEQIFQSNGFLAGTDRERAGTLNSLLADEEVKAVVAARGGHGCLRLLDLIDLDAVRNRPKIILGFSDATALLLALHQASGLVTFHGPVVTSLGEADDLTLSHLFGLITGRQVFPLTLEGATVVIPGSAEGPLLGGNLTLLVHLLAAGRLPDLHGAILFIEDTNEAPYRLDRMLTTLRLAGVLESLQGLICGHFEDCGPEEEVQSVLRSALENFHGPAVAGFPVGHGVRNLTLPVGPKARLDTRSGVLDLIGPYLA